MLLHVMLLLPLHMVLRNTFLASPNAARMHSGRVLAAPPAPPPALTHAHIPTYMRHLLIWLQVFQ